MTSSHTQEEYACKDKDLKDSVLRVVYGIPSPAATDVKGDQFKKVKDNSRTHETPRSDRDHHDGC